MAKTAININESIPANDSVSVLVNTRFENVQNTGFLMLAQTAAATGLEAELYVASRNALERSPVGDQNRTPQLPEDVVVDQVDAFRGEKIQLKVYNTTVGDVIYQARLILDDNVRFLR